MQISGKEDRSETKILVRNLAFEATAKDVRGLMNPFGHVKTCRLPKKFDGSTRGFAFVEFATKGEAQNAVRSVHHTHLYGRRLLVEYAEGEAGVDELRAKAAAKIHREEPENKPPRKRQKGVKPSLSTVKDKP
jgi:multiple RNA-binding domain-containing protein 1